MARQDEDVNAPTPENDPAALGRRIRRVFAFGLGLVALLVVAERVAVHLALGDAEARMARVAQLQTQEVSAHRILRLSGDADAPAHPLAALDAELTRFLDRAITLADPEAEPGARAEGAGARANAGDPLARAMALFAAEVGARLAVGDDDAGRGQLPRAATVRTLLAALETASRQLKAEEARARMLAVRLTTLGDVTVIAAILALGLLVVRPVTADVVRRLRRAEAARAWAETAARFDPDIGIPRRAAAKAGLDALLADPGRTGQLVCVADIGLIGLQAEIDRLGRRAVEGALRTLAQRLDDVVGGQGLVALNDGAGFLVVLTELFDERELRAAGHRLRDALAPPVAVGQSCVVLAPVIGLASGVAGECLAEPVLEEAAMALAIARRDTAGGVVILTGVEREIIRRDRARLDLGSADDVQSTASPAIALHSPAPPVGRIEAPGAAPLRLGVRAIDGSAVA